MLMGSWSTGGINQECREDHSIHRILRKLKIEEEKTYKYNSQIKQKHKEEIKFLNVDTHQYSRLTARNQNILMRINAQVKN